MNKTAELKRREAFQKARLKKMVSQREVYTALAISESHYRNIESGRGNPDAVLLFKLANYFGESPENLFPDLAAL